MASAYSARRTVKLEDVRQNNIVLANLEKPLRESVFIKEYRRAAEIIREIIANSREISKIEKYNLTELQTAVPFIGDRGTGKSSIMCSVLETLQSYKGGNREAAFYLGDENQNTRFVTFDMIDATPLKAGEDIMEIILSRMLSYLEKVSDRNDFRELYRLIDELHVDLGRIYWKDTQKRDRCGIMALQQVAESKKTIARFQKLVEEFTKTISANQFGGNSCYLVVALDDIDMYQGACNGSSINQFALLEHIYYHMRVPGLIVLMTYNEHILRRKCNEHFSVIYNGNHKTSTCNQAETEAVDELTAQFMSKLFPQERRIYLPNYMFIDLGNRSNLYVQPTLECGDEDEKLELSVVFKQDDSVPVKDFILRLIAHKTGVYFDAAGSKKHFLEPRNLRELGELYQVISSMEKVIPNSPKINEIRKHNRQALLDYLYNQFSLKTLASDEYRTFRKLSMLPLDRQERTLIDQIRIHRKSLKLDADDIGHLSKTSRDRWRYSYGELLHNIYFSTRIPQRNNSDNGSYYSKEFMQCILGTHSVILNQQICENSANEAMQLSLGSSIAGRWANEMLPKFYYGESRKTVAAGSLSMPVREFFDWVLPADVETALLNLLRQNSRSDRKIVSQYLEALVVGGMFFTGFPRNGLKIALEPDIDTNKQITIALRSNCEDHICFNVMNFTINLFSALSEKTGYISFIKQKLSKLGREFPSHLLRDWDTELLEVQNLLAERVKQVRKERYFDVDFPDEQIDDSLIKKYAISVARAEAWKSQMDDYHASSGNFIRIWESILSDVIENLTREIRSWHEKYGYSRMVLPVQHFDMMYNIIKRLANIYYHDIPEEASVEEVYDYYVYLYENVVEELKAQDAVYSVGSNLSFVKPFQDSLFFRVFTADESTRNPYIKQVLVDMMKKALPAQDARNTAASLTTAKL